MTEILIDSEFINLGQFLKLLGVISTGGEAKWYLKENQVIVNDISIDQRGKKLFPGDVIMVENQYYKLVAK